METDLLVTDLDFFQTQAPSVRLPQIRRRAQRCVCRYCGQPLSLRKITYAAYDEAKIESYCEHCGRIEHGVEPEIYKIAAYFIDEMQFDHYSNLDDSAQKRRMNIAVVCDIIFWSFKNAGLLTDEGFQVALNMHLEEIGESVLLAQSDLWSALEGGCAGE